MSTSGAVGGSGCKGRRQEARNRNPSTSLRRPFLSSFPSFFPALSSRTDHPVSHRQVRVSIPWNRGTSRTGAGRQERKEGRSSSTSGVSSVRPSSGPSRTGAGSQERKEGRKVSVDLGGSVGQAVFGALSDRSRKERKEGRKGFVDLDSVVGQAAFGALLGQEQEARKGRKEVGPVRRSRWPSPRRTRG